MSRIAAALKSFQVGFDVAILESDPEVAIFAQDIIAALVAGGWKQADWKIKDGFHRYTGIRFGQSTPIVGTVSIIGVHIQAHADAAEKLNAAADALLAALDAEGLKASTDLLTVENANPKLLHVLVGRKPY